MTALRLAAIVVALLVSTLATADWAAAQGQPGQGGRGGPRMMCQDRFTSMDTNKDGLVDADEFASVPHRRANPEAVFKSMDVDADGAVTKEELCAGKGMRGGRWQ